MKKNVYNDKHIVTEPYIQIEQITINIHPQGPNMVVLRQGIKVCR